MKSVGVDGLLQSFTQDIPVIVLFHWKDCGHCKTMMPAWDAATKEMRNILAAKIENAELSKLPPSMNVQFFPRIVILRKGKLVDEYHGDRSKESILAFAKPHAKAASAPPQTKSKSKTKPAVKRRKSA